jgi:hypothetical protein
MMFLYCLLAFVAGWVACVVHGKLMAVEDLIKTIECQSQALDKCRETMELQKTWMKDRCNDG